MYPKEKPRYSRTVSRIAAGDYDAYQERLSAETLECLLSDPAQQSFSHDRIMEINAWQSVMGRERRYFEFRHKNVRHFDCDNPEDSGTEYVLFPTKITKSGEKDLTVISINTPPYGIPYDSEQPFGSPERPDEQIPSAPTTPVQVRRYSHPVHKAESSISGGPQLNLSPPKGVSPEAASIAEQPPAVETFPQIPSVDAAIPKKKKKKAKRKKRHTGPKAKARVTATAAAAAAAEESAEHGVSSEKEDDNEDTIVQDEHISAPSDTAKAAFPEKQTNFTQSSFSAPDEKLLTSRQPSEFDSLAVAKHDLAQHAIVTKLTIDGGGAGNRTSQGMNQFDTAAVVEIPGESLELQEACFADDEQTPEVVHPPMWDVYQPLAGERPTASEGVYFTQWDSSYPNIAAVVGFAHCLSEVVVVLTHRWTVITIYWRQKRTQTTPGVNTNMIVLVFGEVHSLTKSAAPRLYSLHLRHNRKDRSDHHLTTLPSLQSSPLTIPPLHLLLISLRF
ncbi:hypothetical protein N7533_012073 [Penicillium manginii]|uniref:uncharacterized protein n=1 Tax=Penicillium manginii TaxID=203109 RepID=UPI002547C8DF|nr:uncharacterized protein N7533_012073 [Penicillium manginii]KAJ5739289.1 hypothetical protein N7533_012073 [Penicillium manginii]